MVNLIRMEDIMYENEIQSIAARESDAEIYAGLLQLTKDIAKQKWVRFRARRNFITFQRSF